MKKIMIFAAVTAAAMLASCSNTNEAVTEPSDEAILTISVCGEGEEVKDETRATGIISNNADNKINNYVAYVFKSNGQLEEAIVSTTSASKASTRVTTAAAEVYVVANATTTTIGAVTSKSDLLSKLGNLANGTVSTQTSSSSGSIWASGSASLSFTLNPTTKKYTGTVTVPVKFIPARINLTLSNQITEGDIKTFAVKQIAVLNANTQTFFFGDTSLVPSGTLSYYSGISMTGMEYVPTNYSTKTFLLNTYTTSQNNYHYYVFENTETFPTILTVIGEVTTKIGGAKETCYFPLHFAAYDEVKEPVRRGQSYNVSMTLTGSADDLPGITDPTIPSVDASLQVTVTPSTWTARTITKEF